MDWLNRLKTMQKVSPDTIPSFPITPPGALSKLSKVPAALPLVTDGRDLPHYCGVYPGGCWCTAKLPDSDYPAGCVNCKYHQAAKIETRHLKMTDTI